MIRQELKDLCRILSTSSQLNPPDTVKYNWDAIIEEACWHRVLPILINKLDISNDKNDYLVPENNLAKLREFQKTNNIQISLQLFELKILSEILANAKINFLVLKGLTLSELIYKSINIRTSKDIDILIDQNDIVKIINVLESFDYQVEHPNTNNIKNKEIFYKFNNQIQAWHKDRNICIEIHWTFTTNPHVFNPGFEEIYNNSLAIQLKDLDIRTLPLHETIIYLSCHFTRTHRLRLKWLCDINSLVNNQTLDWSYLNNLAKRYSGEFALSGMLTTCNKLLSTPLPKALSHKFFIRSAPYQALTLYIIDSKSKYRKLSILRALAGMDNIRVLSHDIVQFFARRTLHNNMTSKLNLDLGPSNFFAALFKLSSKDSLIIVLLNLLSSITESCGFAMLLPILNLTGFESSVINSPSHNILGYLSTGKLSLGIILCLFSLILCIFAIFSFLRTIYLNKAEWTIAGLEQEKLFSSIANSSWAKTITQRKSDLIELLMRETRQVGFAYVQGSSMFSSFITFLLLTAMACFISLSATLLSLTLGLFIILITRPLNKRVYQAGKDSYPAYQELFAQCDAHLECLPLIKIFNSTKLHIKNFTEGCTQLSNINRNFVRAKAKTALYYRFSVACSLGLSAYISISYKFLSIPEFIVLSALFSRIVPQLQVLHHAYQTFLNCIPSYIAISDAINYFDSNCEGNYLDSIKHEFDISKGINFDKVSYCYPEASDKMALDNISINLNNNGIIYISGPSGSGKSTFSYLLTGLILPSTGSIRVGENIIDSSNIYQWRKQIGYVPQETILPYTTIKESLLLAKPDASEQQIWEILEKVALSKVIQNLPLKLDSLLGDRGCLLSGGERQRLSIARALLNNPRILILDEATNALDKETEDIIFSVLETYSKNALIVIISHQEISKLTIGQRIIFKQGRISS